ncbi:glycosyltransferase [Arthrobacter sp.]|uniref:glycosyltransferase n=1 Tax=Arthrobacter sp. TaxID=1667 RepID=UPI0028116A93|nr:glycosyltransferase [Arthrobacter sp.]
MKQWATGANNYWPTLNSNKTPSAQQKKSVVIVSSAHPWTDNRIHYREAATLASAGHRVTLIAVETNNHVPAAPGVNVVRIRKRSRLARFTFGTCDAIIRALRTRAQVFHLHDPELIPAIPFLRLIGKTVIYDAHEDLSSQIVDKPYIPAKLAGLAVSGAKLLVSVSSMADHVVAATEKIAESYPTSKVRIVRNYPPLRVADHKALAVSSRASNVVYVGALSDSRGIPQIVRAAELFPEGWNLVLAGHGATPSYRGSLQNLTGWKRVIDHGVVSPDDARDLMLSARVGLVTLQKTAAYLDSLPTKMFEYMSAGIPIIASNFPLWRKIIETYDCGTLVDETDPVEIANAVQRYADDRDLLLLHGGNARRAAEDALNWGSQGRVLTDLYSKLQG